MKAILIARVSTEEQKEMGNSLPAQVARLEKYCANKGYTVHQVCSFDESAYSTDRTEFDRIIDLILSFEEKVIVCCDKVDRLSRNVFDKRISTLYERALADRIELHFVSDGQIITSHISAVEKFQFGISLGLAKYYSDAISDNVRRAMEQKLRKGEWVAKAPYGYKNVVLENGKKDVVLDEYAARIVHKAFELYATGAYSMDLVCKKIKEDYGLDWRVSYIDKMFKNPFYYGEMRVNEKNYPHRYPPVIDKALFDAVQKVKAHLNKKPVKYAGKPYIYRGLLRCAVCGLAITPEKHKGHIYYHCTQYKGKHNAKWFREEAITQALSNLFKKLQLPQEAVASINYTLNELHENKASFEREQYARLSKEHKTLGTMMDNLYVDKLKGRITESEYDKFYTKFRDELDEATIKIDQLQKTDHQFYQTARSLLKVATHAHDLFVGSEVEEKRQLIKLILQNFNIDAENIVWELHKPFDLLLKCSEDIQWRPQGESNSYYRRERAVS